MENEYLDRKHFDNVPQKENSQNGLLNSVKKNVKELFKSKNTKDEQNVIEIETINPDTIKVGETYQQWGTRICGKVAGNKFVLAPFLQQVYYQIYSSQTKDADLQNELKNETLAKINTKKSELETLKKQSTKNKEKISALKEELKELKNNKLKIEGKKEEINKEQRLRLIIGLVILIPLTIYLFVFYSSTFYSAFFREAESITGLSTAMFDANAIPNALKDGVMELIFVLCAPIIFLGLGFCLHLFSLQNGISKYLKMGSIILITLIFDCILAYRIGAQLHNFRMITGVVPRDQIYTMSLAFQDSNTWAVIFCGFIVYIIWGLVFDMIMSAYRNMDLNKTKLEDIKREIRTIKAEIDNTNQEDKELDEKKNQKENEINILELSLSDNVRFKPAAIKHEMNNFFSGWLIQLKTLSMSNKVHEEAQKIFDQAISDLFPNK